MYKGKYSNKKRRLTPWMALALALVLTISAGGTMAYLFTSTDPVENTFTPARIYTEVQESFTGNTKSNVTIYNGYTDSAGNSHDSEADVYIRVALVPTWEDDAGNAVAMSASLSDLDIAWGADWHKHADGFYYYTKKVVAGGSTGVLIDSAKVKIDSAGYQAGYRMNLQILAQAIQAEPSNAVLDAWDFVPDSN